MSERSPTLSVAGIDTRRQLVTFAGVGLASNAALYCAYLVLTAIGLGPKTAMSLCYCGGVLLTFLFNRRFTFRHRGHLSGSAVRYVALHASAYIGNFVVLAILVDEMRLPHRLVVLACIVVTACIMFVLQKLWVFPGNRDQLPP